MCRLITMYSIMQIQSCIDTILRLVVRCFTYKNIIFSCKIISKLIFWGKVIVSKIRQNILTIMKIIVYIIIYYIKLSLTIFIFKNVYFYIKI